MIPGIMSAAFSSWFSSLSSCFGARKKSRSSTEKNIVVLRDQPAAISRPSAEPLWSSERTYERTLQQERSKTRLRRPASRGSTARKNWFGRSSTSVHRLRISGPTDFRHVQSESFQFPPQTSSRPRPRSFRPIELSIYDPQNRLSPILPHLEWDITPPPRAYTANSSRWDASSGTTLHNERSLSSMSFHLPRKHIRHESGISDVSMTPPRIPPKSRARASTAPNPRRIVERIASAILEKERLQAEIDSVVERQSIYMGSRPSTGYDMRDLEPMPSIPALPAAAPSFAERLSIDDRPRTAPSQVRSMTVQEKTLELTAAAQSQPSQPPYRASRYRASPETGAEDDAQLLDRPLAPPLPLVLRPPLRKKKSFSRVSSWLFHPDGTPHSSTDSSPTMVITTSPRPVRKSDGFYQCLAPPEGLPRTSMETSSSVYTWETRGEDDNDEEESKTVPTTAATWSPEQTPKQGSSRHTTPVIGVARVGSGLEKEKEKEMRGALGVAAAAGGAGIMDGHRPTDRLLAYVACKKLNTSALSIVKDISDVTSGNPYPRSARRRLLVGAPTESSRLASRFKWGFLSSERGIPGANGRNTNMVALLDYLRRNRSRYTSIPTEADEADENQHEASTEPTQFGCLEFRGWSSRVGRFGVVNCIIAIFLLVLALYLVPFVWVPRGCGHGNTGLGCGTPISRLWGQYSPYFPVPSEIDPEIPPGCEPTFVQVLSRHGARAPTGGRAKGYAALIDRIHKQTVEYGEGVKFLRTYTYSLGAEHLTPFGRDQMFDSGSKFYDRYRSLARQSVPFVRAAGQARVVQSAQKFTEGYHSLLESDHGADNATLPKYPYEILVIPETPTSNNTLHHSLCPAFENGTYSAIGTSAQAAYLATFAPRITARLNTRLPGANLTDADTVALMDLCPFETVAQPFSSSFSISSSTLSPFCHLFTHPEWLAYDYHQSLGKWYGFGPGNPLGPTQGVGFVNELVARLTRTAPVRDGTSTNATLDADPRTFPVDRALYADFGHDNDMMTVLGALRVYEGVGMLGNGTREGPEGNGGFAGGWAVPFAARAYVEKMRCWGGGEERGEGEEEEMVRVLVNDRVMPLRGCGADQWGMCTLSRFVESMAFARGNGRWDLCFA
ncbi:phosphoglycerate mutase-like protein [Parathielavia hyrcaniae]|uniref:3-phytase n=1 Tax=Parathielavia hyrcaniae TaxID=113614 RepID=A0AAN6T089_9PEZI|nr:phosphoglycerate mutase-like protein [Parathielavia hyrcaniae]